MPFHPSSKGPAWFCKVAGTGPFSPDTAPVPNKEEGSHRAAGPAEGLPGQEGMETQKRRCDPPAGSHQSHAVKESPEKEEKRCKFSSSWRKLCTSAMTQMFLRLVCKNAVASVIPNFLFCRCFSLLSRDKKSSGSC